MLTVVLASSTDTLLRVECTLQFGHIRVRINGPEEYGLVLGECEWRRSTLEVIARRTWFMPALAKSSVGSS